MKAEDRISTLVAMLVESAGYDDDTKEQIYDSIMQPLSERPEGYQILADKFTEILTDERKVRVEQEDIENSVNDGDFENNPVSIAIKRQYPDWIELDSDGIEFSDGSLYTLTQPGYDWLTQWAMHGNSAVEPTVITLH